MAVKLQQLELPLSNLATAIKEDRVYHVFDWNGAYVDSFFFPQSAKNYRDTFFPFGSVKYLTNQHKES